MNNNVSNLQSIRALKSWAQEFNSVLKNDKQWVEWKGQWVEIKKGQATGTGSRKVSSKEIIEKTNSLVKALIVPKENIGTQIEILKTIDTLDQSLISLKDRIKIHYYSGFLGTIRKLLQNLGFFQFDHSRIAKEINSVKEEMQAKLLQIDQNKIQEAVKILKEKIDEKRAYIKGIYSAVPSKHFVGEDYQNLQTYLNQLDQIIRTKLSEERTIFREDLGYPEIPNWRGDGDQLRLYHLHTYAFGDYRGCVLSLNKNLPQEFKQEYLNAVKRAANRLFTHCKEVYDKYPVPQRTLDEAWQERTPEERAILQEAYDRIILSKTA